MSDSSSRTIQNAVVGVNISSLVFIENYLEKNRRVDAPLYWIEDQDPEDPNHWDCLVSNSSFYNEHSLIKLNGGEIDLILDSSKRIQLREAFSRELFKKDILNRLINLCIDNNAYPKLWQHNKVHYSWKKQQRKNRIVFDDQFEIHILNKKHLRDHFLSQNRDKIYYLGENIFAEKIVTDGQKKHQIILNAPNKPLFVKNVFQKLSSNSDFYGQWDSFYYKIPKEYLSGMAPLSIVVNNKPGKKPHSFLHTGIIENSEIYKILCFQTESKYYNVLLKKLSRPSLDEDLIGNPIKILYPMFPYLKERSFPFKSLKSFDDSIYHQKSASFQWKEKHYYSCSQFYC